MTPTPQIWVNQTFYNLNRTLYYVIKIYFATFDDFSTWSFVNRTKFPEKSNAPHGMKNYCEFEYCKYLEISPKYLVYLFSGLNSLTNDELSPNHFNLHRIVTNSNFIYFLLKPNMKNWHQLLSGEDLGVESDFVAQPQRVVGVVLKFPKLQVRVDQYQ